MKFAVVGCGKVALLSHIPALKEFEKHGLVELVAVADVKEEVAKRTAKMFDIPAYYTNSEELAKRADLDAVSICTPSMTHADLCILFARAGKHVLVEKPMCHTYEEALAIKDAVEETGVTFSVVQNFRCERTVQEAKERIMAGHLGRILYIHGVFNGPFPIVWSRSLWYYQPGGVIHDRGPHIVDLVLWLKGIKGPEDIRSVQAAGGDMLGQAGFANHACAFIEFSDGSSATSMVSWLIGGEEMMVKLYGTGGMLLLDILNGLCMEIRGGMNPFALVKRYYKVLKIAVADIIRRSYPHVQLAKLHREFIRRFIMALEGHCRPPVELGEALATMLVIDEMVKQTISQEGRLQVKQRTNEAGL